MPKRAPNEEWERKSAKEWSAKKKNMKMFSKTGLNSRNCLATTQDEQNKWEKITGRRRIDCFGIQYHCFLASIMVWYTAYTVSRNSNKMQPIHIESSCGFVYARYMG